MTAQEEERRHISRELHDDLNQQVAVLSIMLSNIKREVPQEAKSLRTKLNKVQNYAAEITENIRRLSHELRPMTLEHLGLASALRKYLTDFGRIHGIQIGFTPAAGTIPQDAAVCLYRIAQESLSNIIKHSGAKTAEVTLTTDDCAVHLDVADSGCGFDLDTARKNGGLGLAGMEERIRLVNGSLTISTHPGSGSRLHATIPLH
jgi:signal transduction histidine kinase